MRGPLRSVIKRSAEAPCSGTPSEFEIIAPLTAAAFFTAAMLYWLAG